MIFEQETQTDKVIKKMIDENIIITSEKSKEDNKYVCNGLYSYNVEKTRGLLKKPGVNIELYLKTNEGKTIGAILCDTFSYCMYIDVMWIDEAYRGKGYGKALINSAEKIAKENGCIFSHTCTFSYQSPWVYKSCGYEVFAIIEDYPDDIKQYFLKKVF